MVLIWILVGISVVGLLLVVGAIVVVRHPGVAIEKEGSGSQVSAIARHR